MSAAGIKKTEKFLKSFDNIGKTNGTAFPTEAFIRPKDAKSNAQADAAFEREHAVYEFAAAHLLAKAATSRLETAKETLKELGVIPDELTPGLTHSLHDGSTVQLMCKVNMPAQQTNMKDFISALRKKGVKQETIDACYAEATSDKSPAKNMIPVLLA